MMLPAVICVLACALSFLLGCWGAVTWCRRINKCILGQRDDVDRWQREMDAGVSREMQRRLKMRIASKKALKDTGENLAIKDDDSIGAVQPSQAQEDTTRRIQPANLPKGTP